MYRPLNKSCTFQAACQGYSVLWLLTVLEGARLFLDPSDFAWSERWSFEVFDQRWFLWQLGVSGKKCMSDNIHRCRFTWACVTKHPQLESAKLAFWMIRIVFAVTTSTWSDGDRLSGTGSSKYWPGTSVEEGFSSYMIPMHHQVSCDLGDTSDCISCTVQPVTRVVRYSPVREISKAVSV